MAILTTEQAREAQAKSAESRRNNKAIAAQIVALTGEQTTYLASQLADVREHIQTTSDLMRTTSKPGDREKLARAMNYLREQERILAGRPLPGQLRPPKESKAIAKPAIYALPV